MKVLSRPFHRDSQQVFLS
ncbi:unnamed protein product [Cyprideis torosa]|uniref:Uncharacterized protein n=1 Tax=Cyprideis torosa TaxID=163714 RepID=A0A7R8WVX9_9CRUS|nr:unnamed protein product [Cyprideis torosa]CAG0907574.1 unnamed protein product [Cyprideis torosa]